MTVSQFKASFLCMRLGIYGPYFSDGSVLEICQDIYPTETEKTIYWRTMGPVLRIRKIDGATIDVPKGVFVELCDEDGKIGAVVYQTSKGVIRVITPDDINEVQQYKGIFKVSFCSDVVEIKQTIHDSINPKSTA